jgi:hypothetical protein
VRSSTGPTTTSALGRRSAAYLDASSPNPAIEASGIARPARIYDLRSTFASNALAAGVSVFELARITGTSVAMIERSYGTLIEGAGADIARRLGVFEAEREGDDQGERAEDPRGLTGR